MIYRFYDNLFQYHYNRLKGEDPDPEVVPIAIISFSQSAHLIFIYILFYYLLEFKFLKIEYSIFVFYFFSIGINYYIYIIKNRKEKILATEKILPKNIKLISFFYMILSIAAPLLLIYFFKEIAKIA